MVTEINAELVSSDPIDGIWTVAFADANQENYLLIQRDVENVLGESTPDVHYVEFGSQSRGCHGGVKSARVTRSRAIFRFSSAAAERIRTAEVVVSFSLNEHEYAALSNALAKIIDDVDIEFL